MYLRLGRAAKLEAHIAWSIRTMNSSVGQWSHCRAGEEQNDLPDGEESHCVNRTDTLTPGLKLEEQVPRPLQNTISKSKPELKSAR